MASAASSSETENVDDEVEQELDVYLSKSLNGKLYLLQYPVKSSKKKFSSKDHGSAKIKPKNNRLEMDVPLDISSPNYNQSKGEQIALNVDGNDATSQASTVFDTNVMDKQTLHSTLVPLSGKRYICGIVHNGDLHLTPISHVMQLRPSFKYMDQAEHRAVRAAKAKEAAEADSSQDEAEEAKAVTLRIKGAETEAARLARERSYAAYEKRLAEEKWCALKVYRNDDSLVERDRQKLLCQKMVSPDGNMSRQAPEMARTPSEYLGSLAPVYSKHVVDNTAIPNNVLSVSLLKNESLGDQIKLIMKNAKIIKFSHLLSLLSGSPDPKTVVRSLQSYAVLVGGCWIVKSDVLFPPETVSPISGTLAESLCRSRDYILFMFTKKEYQARKEITAAVKIPSDDVKAILDDIAVMRVGLGWKLRLLPDHDFVTRFPEVAERQTMLWNALGAKLAKLMNLPNLLTESNTVNHGKTDGPAVSRRKKNSSSSDDKNSSKSSKPAAKKQRKPSGPKANNPSRVIKSEPMSPTHFQNRQLQQQQQLNGESQLVSPNSIKSNENSLLSLSAMLLPTKSAESEQTHDFCNLNSFSAEINIESVNSTVQSITDEITKIASPDRPPFIDSSGVNSNNDISMEDDKET